MLKNLWIVIIGLALLPVPQLAFAPNSSETAPDAPPNPACFELGTCDLFSSPLDVMIEPFINIFGEFFFVIVWGIIIGVIWLRTNNTMLTGVVGIGVASVLAFNERTIVVGVILLGAAVSIVVFQLYTQRLHFPTN